jgi:DNA-binding MarR family transcriptional regulator
VQATVASPQEVAELLNKLSHHINRTASPDMFRVLGEVDLSFTQLKAMFLLDEHRELTVKDLSERLSMSFPAMSRAVEGLVQRAFVTRRENESDRRSRHIALLPQGRDALDRVLEARQAALVTFVSELTDAERNSLHAALLPIAERISPR